MVPHAVQFAEIGPCENLFISIIVLVASNHSEAMKCYLELDSITSSFSADQLHTVFGMIRFVSYFNGSVVLIFHRGNAHGDDQETWKISKL